MDRYGRDFHAAMVALSGLLEKLERELGLRQIGIELMIETPLALMRNGRVVAAELLDERVVAVHLGAYDLTAELGVTAVDQRLDHPFCDLARMLLRLALADTRVRISDGATTTLPTPAKDLRGEEATAVVHRAWALHARNMARAIDVGIWEGWDLHPAQLPARYGALYAYFLARKDALNERWRAFCEREQRATRVGEHFDDAATGRGLRASFERGVACGAFEEMP
jgi:citrate lyase beta subunit